MDKKPRTKHKQIAIDSAKRSFDVDVTREIKRFKRELNVCDKNGYGNLYPKFWKNIQSQWVPYKTITGSDEKKSLINDDLQCPMNCVNEFRIGKPKNSLPVIDNSKFFVSYKPSESRRKCKNIEKLIEKYSIEIKNTNTCHETEHEDYLLLRNDFDEMIDDIRKVHISNNYLGLMSYLINRALGITPALKANKGNLQSNLHKNRSILLKTLYNISPKQFLQCFTKKADT